MPAIVIEPDEEVFGVSINGPNPNLQHYFGVEDKATAERLSDHLNKSRTPQQVVSEFASLVSSSAECRYVLQSDISYSFYRELKENMHIGQNLLLNELKEICDNAAEKFIKNLSNLKF